MGISTQEASEIVERAEAIAWEDIMNGVPGMVASEHSIRTWRVRDGVGFMFDNPPNPFLNRFHGLGVLTPTTDAALAAAVEPWRGTGTVHVVHAVPDDLAPGLSKLLEAAGLSPGRNWVKVLRGDEAVADVPTDLRIEEIGPDRAEDFAQLEADVFELPEAQTAFGSIVGREGWHVYLAFDGSEPVAAGSLLVRDGVGWLGSGATLPSHRGRGAQGAIMSRRIRDGIALGCRHLVTETGEETPEEPNHSYRNMIRTGFRLVYARRNWIATAANA
jgi:hypothetical protein